MRLEDIDQIDSVVLSSGDALIVVDMQNDFMPGGTLQVEKGDTIISGVNSAMQLFNHKDLCVVMTQDWHPILHDSFASAHEGKLPFDPIEAPGIGPVLWPDHCIQSTQGADFHLDIMTDLAQAVIRKGYHKSMDSYSGFLENDKKTTTGLDGYLKSKGIQRIFVCGLALDYCVFFTSADGIALGYEVFVLADLSLPVGSPENSIVYALTTMQNRGVRFAISSALK
jgi:nicotinamidase/pyrazinamidase